MSLSFLLSLSLSLFFTLLTVTQTSSGGENVKLQVQAKSLTSDFKLKSTYTNYNYNSEQRSLETRAVGASCYKVVQFTSIDRQCEQVTSHAECVEFGSWGVHQNLAECCEKSFVDECTNTKATAKITVGIPDNFDLDSASQEQLDALADVFLASLELPDDQEGYINNVQIILNPDYEGSRKRQQLSNSKYIFVIFIEHKVKDTAVTRANVINNVIKEKIEGNPVAVDVTTPEVEDIINDEDLAVLQQVTTNDSQPLTWLGVIGTNMEKTPQPVVEVELEVELEIVHEIDYNLDSDNDGISDYQESNLDLTDPNDIDSYKDTDGDGVPDSLDSDATDRTVYVDSDGDGVSDYRETYHDSTDPNYEGDFIDSDNDGVSDGQESNIDLTDPNDPNDFLAFSWTNDMNILYQHCQAYAPTTPYMLFDNDLNSYYNPGGSCNRHTDRYIVFEIPEGAKTISSIKVASWGDSTHDIMKVELFECTAVNVCSNKIYSCSGFTSGISALQNPCDLTSINTTSNIFKLSLITYSGWQSWTREVVIVP